MSANEFDPRRNAVRATVAAMCGAPGTADQLVPRLAEEADVAEALYYEAMAKAARALRTWAHP